MTEQPTLNKASMIKTKIQCLPSWDANAVTPSVMTPFPRTKAIITSCVPNWSFFLLKPWRNISLTYWMFYSDKTMLKPMLSLRTSSELPEKLSSGLVFPSLAQIKLFVFPWEIIFFHWQLHISKRKYMVNNDSDN